MSLTCLFVCVEVLRPSQSNEVMLSAFFDGVERHCVLWKWPCASLKLEYINHLYEHFGVWQTTSRKHTYMILTPFIPHFYIVKLGFTGYTLFFLFLLKIIDCGYSLEPPRRGGSNEYPQSMFWAEIKKISEFLSENFQFLVVKYSIY